MDPALPAFPSLSYRDKEVQVPSTRRRETDSAWEGDVYNGLGRERPAGRGRQCGPCTSELIRRHGVQGDPRGIAAPF